MRSKQEVEVKLKMILTMLNTSRIWFSIFWERRKKKERKERKLGYRTCLVRLLSRLKSNPALQPAPRTSLKQPQAGNFLPSVMQKVLNIMIVFILNISNLETIWLLQRGVIFPNEVGLPALVLGEGEPAGSLGALLDAERPNGLGELLHVGLLVAEVVLLDLLDNVIQLWAIHSPVT